MQEFYIKKGSALPVLRMEIFQDGRFDFKRSMIDNALQDSDVTFSMKDRETGILKVSKSPAEIVLAKTDGCEERYIIQYKWKERDTRNEGIYDGWFEINFRGEIIENGIDYPEGLMKVPIQDDLVIYVR